MIDEIVVCFSRLCIIRQNGEVVSTADLLGRLSPQSVGGASYATDPYAVATAEGSGADGVCAVVTISYASSDLHSRVLNTCDS